MTICCPRCGSDKHVRFDQDVEDGRIYACEECKVIFKIIDHPLVTGAYMIVWVKDPKLD